MILAAVIPVLGDDGEPVLFDMFIGGAWHGSRRKREWAEAYISRQQLG